MQGYIYSEHDLCFYYLSGLPYIVRTGLKAGKAKIIFNRESTYFKNLNVFRYR